MPMCIRIQILLAQPTSTDSDSVGVGRDAHGVSIIFIVAFELFRKSYYSYTLSEAVDSSTFASLIKA